MMTMISNTCLLLSFQEVLSNLPLKTAAPESLNRNLHGDRHARIISVIHVVTISVVVDVDVVVQIPVWSPIFRPWIENRYPVSVVVKARSAARENQLQSSQPEIMTASEINSEAIVGYSIAVIASALAPIAVLGLPRSRTVLREISSHLFAMLRVAVIRADGALKRTA